MTRTQNSHGLYLRSFLRLLLGLTSCLLLFATQSVSGQQACPPPPNYVENPLATPSITAAEVAANPTPDNLGKFALAARDYFLTIGSFDQLQLAHAFCLLRQEGGDWRSGGVHVIGLLFNPELAVNPQAPLNMRVFFHASRMVYAGRLVNPEIAGAILLAASSDRSSGGPVRGLGGHAVLSGGPFVMLVGLDLQEPHMDPHVIDSHYVPQVTAAEVVDRASLKVFVNEAIRSFEQLVETYDFNAVHLVRAVFRDPNGPWISGPVYLFVADPVGYSVFHGAFPDKYEFRITGTERDAVTGELILPQILAAAAQEGGGFFEYHFDNPDDDSDSAEIPKVGYVREQSFRFRGLGRSINYIFGSGFYPGAGAGSGTKMTIGCADRGIAASAVRTQSDIRAFVNCAAEYLAEHGTAEARRAFNEDERWKHGPTYVFVDGIAKSGSESMSYVYPPDPAREGKPWGESIDDFGTDYFYEVDRIMQAVDSGWIYYSFPNPATGRKSAKSSYIMEVDWDGEQAALGAGIYSRDWPGSCYADEVSAAVLGANPNPEALREFVRCAAMVVESEGYFAKEQIERDPRWKDGAHYVYVLDMMGNQVMTGNGLRVNGRALHEWGSGGQQFGGRDLVEVGGTFGETYVYYRSFNPQTGADQPKVGFLKRVVAQGVPLLVGAGYDTGADRAASGPGCSDNFVTAAAVRTQADVQAFVQCAAEYALEHGEEEARRAFNEDARWKSGPTYVFVDALQSSGENALSYVYPPDRSQEGKVWGSLVDRFGNDYFEELHRILSVVDEGWIYYSFNNPQTGRSQPKSSYVIEIDWNGEPATIGAGIYARDLPGTCDPTEVHAADLAANPGDQRLREFVRCAAMEVESAGYFAGPVLSSDPRWKRGPIYVFGINVETGTIEFSGNRASFALSGRIPELLFDGRDAVEAGALFGETFWYYNFNNTATGEVEPKVGFVKLVRAQGVPLLVGSGYNP